jgi:hypothetical protein
LNQEGVENGSTSIGYSEIIFRQRLLLRKRVGYDKASMTIAAGFIHADGVLLCSDTQMEGGATKFQAPKIGMF